jgi:putative nucleotidyltransferase with HDIG domain
VSDAANFLTALAQAFATMVLYAEGHPARERAVDAAFSALAKLQAGETTPEFTFLGDEIVCGRQPVRELRGWDWGRRLSGAGIQRLEFEANVGRDEFEVFLDDVLARLTLSAVGSAEARQMRRSGIRFGSVGVRGELPDAPAVATATVDYSLGVETETIRWLHQQVQHQDRLHLAEAEAVVRSLSVAMHSEQRIMLPLLELRNFDEYTTTHSMNVSVLVMALAEHLGLGGADVRAFGVAGLLHDIGKVTIPLDVLNKPGKLNEEERDLINRHPEAGARQILRAEEDLDLAAIVAYEHHIMIDGSGYPTMRFPRECHFASRLVHVCDVYDALRTKRPYRDAWESSRALAYIGERAGVEFDRDLAEAFTRMMTEAEGRVATLSADGDVIAAAPTN